MKCPSCDNKRAVYPKGNIGAYCSSCESIRNAERRRRRNRLLGRFKQIKGCAGCGYKDHWVALQFDHIVPKKRKGPAINSGWSMKRIKEELSKCQVLCANCHSIKTHDDQFQAKVIEWLK